MSNENDIDPNQPVYPLRVIGFAVPPAATCNWTPEDWTAWEERTAVYEQPEIRSSMGRWIPSGRNSAGVLLYRLDTETDKGAAR